MKNIVFHKYRDKWILASAEQVEGGLTLDAPPVRIIQYGDRERLRAIIEEIFSEPVPVVPEPVYDDGSSIIGIHAIALGLNSWRAFFKDARCFNIEMHKDKLVLEEWPKQGGSFSANAEWRKEVPANGLEQLVTYLLGNTAPTGKRKTPAIKKTSKRLVESNGIIPFGYNMGWFAIRSADKERMSAALGLSIIKELGWNEGINAIYSGGDENCIFVTPAVNGWTFVVGTWACGTGEEDSVHHIMYKWSLRDFKMSIDSEKGNCASKLMGSMIYGLSSDF